MFRLPCGDFKDLDNPEQEGLENLKTYTPDSSRGYIFEVDLKRIYPTFALYSHQFCSPFYNVTTDFP